MNALAICGAATSAILLALTSPSKVPQVKNSDPEILESQTGQPSKTGLASFYDKPQKTASGEEFNPQAKTAAHKTLPLGTRARVTNLKNGKAVSVRINDRGPNAGGRIIDLSKKAANKIGMAQRGVAPVRVTPESGSKSQADKPASQLP